MPGDDDETQRDLGGIDELLDAVTLEAGTDTTVPSEGTTWEPVAPPPPSEVETQRLAIEGSTLRIRKREEPRPRNNDGTDEILRIATQSSLLGLTAVLLITAGGVVGLVLVSVWLL